MTKLKVFKKLKNEFTGKIDFFQKVSLKEFVKKTKFKKDKQLKNIKEKISTINLKNLNTKYWIQYLQDMVDQAVSKTDQNEVLLKQSGFWARAITWVLMGGTAFSIGWLAIAKTDEVVIAVGRLEPKSGVVDVQMPLQGIAREILISEGERVEKGQVLIKLDAEITQRLVSKQTYRHTISNIKPIRIFRFSKQSVIFTIFFLALLVISQFLWVWFSSPLRNALDQLVNNMDSVQSVVKKINNSEVIVILSKFEKLNG